MSNFWVSLVIGHENMSDVMCHDMLWCFVGLQMSYGSHIHFLGFVAEI